MPALSPTMTQGNIARWKVQEGDEVRAGDSVADLTAPAAVKRIKDMDRLGIGHDVGMYLTYPERRGYDVEYADTNDDGDVDPSEGTAVGERSLGDGVMV